MREDEYKKITTTTHQTIKEVRNIPHRVLALSLEVRTP